MRKFLLAFVLSTTMSSGCYTTVGTTSEPVAITYSFGYSYYWGWPGFYGPYYPPYYTYPRYYYPSYHHVYVPSYYEKHPQYRTRDFGNTRQGTETHNVPPVKQNSTQPRNQGNRR